MLLASALVLLGCRAGPTLEEARGLLEDGDPERALAAARVAAEGAVNKRDRISLRRVAFRASLNVGWSHEAAKEYLRLRELTGRDDDALLRDLGRTALRQARRSPERGRRLWALRALGSVLDDEVSASSLRAASSDDDPQVRAQAARVASHLAPLEAALSLLERAFLDHDPIVRRAVTPALRAGVLGRLGDGEAARSQAERIFALARAGARDPDLDVRLASLLLLFDLNRVLEGSAPLDAVAEAVGNGSEAVSRRAGRLLLRVSPERAWRAWRKAQRAVDRESPFGRGLALHAGEVTPATVAEDLRAADYRTRLASAQALAGPGAKALRRSLFALLERDPVAAVRVAALEALLSLGGTTARQALRLASGSAAPEVRRRGFLASEATQAHSVADLVRALEDSALAADVAPLLGSRGGERGTQALVAALDSPDLRRSAAAALSARADVAQRDVFRQLLEDQDPRMRFLAGAALGVCGEAEDLVRLVRSIGDPGGHADLSAAAALLTTLERVRAARPASEPPSQ